MARELWPGTIGPATGVPPRAPGSVRRTLTVDMLRPEGPDGPLVLHARARDLATGSGGAVRSSDAASAELAIEYVPERKVQSVVTQPALEALDALVGVPAARGFRARVAELLEPVNDPPALLLAIFDEIPATTILSRLALLRLGVFLPRVGARPIVGVCAGFAPDSTLTRIVTNDPFPLPVSDGIVAPPLEDPGDPDAWHDIAPLPPGAMRRRRRYDVVPDDDHASVCIDSFFRDSFVEPDGTEASIHEYGVRANVRTADHVVLTIDAVAHVLPAPECPSALTSVRRCVGRSLDELTSFVGEELVGVTACTHLSDHVRAFGRLGPLLREVAASRAGDPSP